MFDRRLVHCFSDFLQVALMFGSLTSQNGDHLNRCPYIGPQDPAGKWSITVTSGYGECSARLKGLMHTLYSYGLRQLVLTTIPPSFSYSSRMHAASY